MMREDNACWGQAARNPSESLATMTAQQEQQPSTSLSVSGRKHNAEVACTLEAHPWTYPYIYIYSTCVALAAAVAGSAAGLFLAALCLNNKTLGYWYPGASQHSASAFANYHVSIRTLVNCSGSHLVNSLCTQTPC